MQVDETAPVVARATVLLDAPREVAWDALADLARWPEWNPDVSAITVSGPLAPGTEFKWRAGIPITSRLEAVRRPDVLAWSGRTFGIRAVHVWTFEQADGGTRATSAESWSGPLARLFRGPLRKQLEDSLEGSMPHYRAEVQRRAGSA